MAQSKLRQTSVLIDNIKEHKDLKKTLRTKNNVVILYISNQKAAQNVIKALDEAAQSVKGEATAILIDCSLRYGKISIFLFLSKELDEFDYLSQI